MLARPMDVLTEFPVRKTKKQKQAFRDAVQSYASGLGYPVTVEKDSLGCKNMIIGDPNSARYLVTAHYDTPASIGLPNLITPCNFAAYILWQLLLVGIFLLVAFGIGFAAGFIGGSAEAGFFIGYIAYFAFLFLLLFGPANPSNANDNTSGVVTVLSIAQALPEDQRSKVCFVLFDLEEAGLVGSSAYRKAHKKATNEQIILNLDCVGQGDEILLFPTKKLKKDPSAMADLELAAGTFGRKTVTVHKKGFSVYPSDQRNFPYGVGIAAFCRSKAVGLYLGRIHTKRDTVLEEENVNTLCDRLIAVITG